MRERERKKWGERGDKKKRKKERQTDIEREGGSLLNGSGETKLLCERKGILD